MDEVIGLKEGIGEANASIPKSSIGQSSVDLASNAKKKEAIKCEHFSIRGYVADIRRINWEMCWPFFPPSKHDDLEGQLSNMLPPLRIPKFRFWDCKKCVQTNDASDNAEDVTSIGRRDATNTSVDVNGPGNCPMTHSARRENTVITMPDIEQVELTSKNNNTVAKGVDDTLTKQSIREVKDSQCHKGAVNLNLETCALFGCEWTSSGITSNGVSEVDKTWEKFKSADIVSFRRRKFRPCESSDYEDEDVHNLHGQCSASQLADPSQVTKFKRTRKFRLLSDILRDSNSGVSAEISNSKCGTSFGDVCTKIVQTKDPYQPDRLTSADQTYFGNGIKEKNKKRNAFHGEDHNLRPMRCAQSLAKSNFDQRGQEENDFEHSVGLRSNGESHFPENRKRRKVSQDHIDDEERLSEDRWQPYAIKCWQGFAITGKSNHKIMGEGEVEHVVINEQNNTYQIQVGACPTRPKDIPFLRNSEKNNLNQIEAITNPNNYRDNKMGESEALDDISLEIVELLAKSRHDRRCQEAQHADQNKLSIVEKTENVKKPEDVSRVSGKKIKKIRKTCKSSRFDEKQMLQCLDKKGSLALPSSHPNHFDGTQFVEAATGDKLGDQFCRWDGDNLLNKKSISYSHAHPTLHMISRPMEIQGANLVSRQSQEGNDLGVHRKILLEQPWACTRKKIGNLAKPDTYTNKYMPATELLQLMEAGMCPTPTVPRLEKLNQLPIQSDYSKEQLPFSYGSTKDLSKQELSNCFSKNHSNLGMSSYPSGPVIYPTVFPVPRHENSASCVGIRESQKMLSETVESTREKGKNLCSTLEVNFGLKKPSCGNGDLGKRYDPFRTNVLLSKLGSLPLGLRLTYDSIAADRVGNGKVATLQHMNGNSGLEMCSVNRNPADFTIPGPGNRFMIGSRQMKVGRPISKRGRPRKKIMEVHSFDENAHN